MPAGAKDRRWSIRWREDNKSVGIVKRWTSALFYKCINAVSEVPIAAHAADFRLMDRAVVNCLIAMPERSRFLRGMISWVGFRQTALPYAAHPRFAGTSKYSLRKMVSLALQGLTSFSSLPLRFSGYMGTPRRPLRSSLRNMVPLRQVVHQPDCARLDLVDDLRHVPGRRATDLDRHHR